MSQLDLLSRPAAPVQPAAVGLPGPRLWIRRLAIWRTRDAERPVRDISFKPGLNVIWSPDPSETPSSDPNAPQALGHGGGKTLLCRLIRYCLGEGRFATDALAERIQANFKDGFVGAIAPSGLVKALADLGEARSLLAQWQADGETVAVMQHARAHLDAARGRRSGPAPRRVRTFLDGPTTVQDNDARVAGR